MLHMLQFPGRQVIAEERVGDVLHPLLRVSRVGARICVGYEEDKMKAFSL